MSAAGRRMPMLVTENFGRGRMVVLATLRGSFLAEYCKQLRVETLPHRGKPWEVVLAGKCGKGTGKGASDRHPEWVSSGVNMHLSQGVNQRGNQPAAGEVDKAQRNENCR